MKQLLTCLTIAAVTVTSALTITQAQENVKEEVLAAQKQFYQAYESCDAEAMESLVTDDMMSLHSTGDLHSNKTEF